MNYLGQKYDQGPTCLPRKAAAAQRLQNFAPADSRTASRLRITRAHTSKQMQQIRNSTPNSNNSTKRGYKTILHVARIA